MSDLTGRTALVTGATDGVGRPLALALARAGADVLVHGRDRARAEALLLEIAAAGGRAAFYPADLGELAQVRRLADLVARDHDRLDILVSNAGIGRGAPGTGREISADGHELRFAVNYLAGFLLTRLLLPLLRAGAASGPGMSRIVNTASLAQERLDFDDVMLTRDYSGGRAYSQSKLAQIVSTMDMAPELAPDGITVTCLHPATLMDTTMVRLAGRPVQSSVTEGMAALLHLAAGEDVEGRTGLYFNGLEEAKADAQAYDPAAQAKLRALSFRLCGLEDPRAA
ncbi:MAG: SDR family NAD(P)-dependent oxidoreductase [Sneathiellaceae bacterium]